MLEASHSFLRTLNEQKIHIFYLVVTIRQRMVEFARLPLHQNDHGLLDEAPDADGDQDGDEQRANGIGNHPVKGPRWSTNAVHEQSLQDLKWTSVAECHVGLHCSLTLFTLAARAKVNTATSVNPQFTATLHCFLPMTV